MFNLFSLFTGLIVGVIFGLLKLPMPAPTTLGAILGVIGIFLGYNLISYFKIGIH